MTSTPQIDEHAARDVLQSDAPEHTDPPAEPPNDVVDSILAAVTDSLETQRLPLATYRVQFNARCRFREMEAVVPYLFTLGISDLYASPIWQAMPDSPHGYDVVDHSRINAEIGTLDELRSLRSALREHDMGLIADVVPNHMSASPSLNLWWRDVLENGPSSQYAGYFDIDWMPLKPDLAHKVLLPVLGEQFGKVLDDGQLVVHYGEGSFWLTYFEHNFPIAPGSYAIILSQRLGELQAQLGESDPDLDDFLSILTAIRNLPPRTELNEERLRERRREKEVIKRRLHELVERSEVIRQFVEQNVRLINGQPGQPHSFDRLDELLQDQAYRLAYWRVAADEINYRRFFDINDLAAICTENPEVFAESHKLLFELQDEGTVTGLRIDHPDGLYDPLGYFCDLQEAEFLRRCHRQWLVLSPSSAVEGENEDAWAPVARRLRELWRATVRIPGSPLARPLYVVVEKILCHGEQLSQDWPVHGTVGYEFLNAVNGIFVDRRHERDISNFYSRFTGESLDFAELAYQCKRLIVRSSLASELSVLGFRLDRVSERKRATRDFTLNSLTRALQEIASWFDVYRTYVQPDHVLEHDRYFVETAVARAKRRNPAISASIFEFVRGVLLLRYDDDADEEERQAIQSVAGKFQQLTGPIMAKAIEDTAFYRFNRLVSLNDVGGEPKQFGITIDAFHDWQQSRIPRWVQALNGTTTHDTKRSEDVRARINVLSEVPKDWRLSVQRWSRRMRHFQTEVDGSPAPGANTEYLLYQTLIGTWPQSLQSETDRATYKQRIQQYMLKVVREAKAHTSWISPNAAYEATLERFVDGVFDVGRRQSIFREIGEFAAKVAEHGYWNSLSQLVVKIASPGVPDFYQGTELWTLTLVDPDNRQPVELVQRRQWLDELLGQMAHALNLPDPSTAVESWLSPTATASDPNAVALFLDQLLASRADGRIKLLTTLLGLRLRRRMANLFQDGDYIPLHTTGRFANQVVAFARVHGDESLLVVVPRWTVSVVDFGGRLPLGEAWEDTCVNWPAAIAKRPDFDVISRQRISPWMASAGAGLPVKTLFAQFPAALVVSSPSSPQ